MGYLPCVSSPKTLATMLTKETATTPDEDAPSDSQPANEKDHKHRPQNEKDHKHQPQNEKGHKHQPQNEKDHKHQPQNEKDHKHHLDHEPGEEHDPVQQGAVYLAGDKLKTRTMNKSQAAKHREQKDSAGATDFFGTRCAHTAPDGDLVCGSFLLEIFGCAVLSKMVHQKYGYPGSKPIGLDYHMDHDLTTAEGRQQARAIIDKEDRTSQLLP